MDQPRNDVRSPIDSDVVPPLEYATPARRPPSGVLFLGQGILWAVVAIIVTLLSLVVIPQFEKTLKDFKVALPPSTQLLLRFSRNWGFLGVWVLPVAVPLLLHAIVPRDEDGRPGLLALVVIRTVTMLILAALVVFVAYSIFAPMISLISSVSGGTSGK